MKFTRLAISGAAILGLVAMSQHANAAAAGSGIDKLYVLDCGGAHAADESRWTPGINVGTPIDLSDNCYLIHNVKGGYMLWDTGVADDIAAMPDGLSQGNGAVVWRRAKTLVSQLAQLNVKPDDVKYIGISHNHADHTSNVDLFPKTPVLLQSAEYDVIFAAPKPVFSVSHPVEKLSGDKDVFGDGSVTIVSTPGHTPGHQSLLVHLNKTGWVVLSGDAVHFKDNWDNRRVPAGNFDKDKTTASMQHLADLMAEHKAALWINHDKPQSEKQKHAPAFYD
jgi:N-acyl homoserine lactone hydrolase